MCSMKKVAEVVSKSASCNYPQRVADGDNVLVPTNDWKSFFQQHCKRIKNIKQYHHFRFTSSAPGSVFCKKTATLVEERFDLFQNNWHPQAEELPLTIPPPGMTNERKWYLYEKIRQFCSDEYKDVTCPLPTTPHPRNTVTF